MYLNDTAETGVVVHLGLVSRNSLLVRVTVLRIELQKSALQNKVRDANTC